MAKPPIPAPVQTSVGFMILEPLTPEALLARHDLLRLLHESIINDPMSMTEDALLEEIYERKAIVWTWGQGIIITSFQDTERGRVLFLSNVRGKGYLANISKIDADIESHAKCIGARYIVGDVPSKGLVRVYESRGARTIHRVVREVK